MKQINKIKMMAIIATGILSFIVTGCSNDEFYGLDYDDNIVDNLSTDGLKQIDTTEYLTISSNCIDNTSKVGYSQIASSQEYLKYMEAQICLCNLFIHPDKSKAIFIDSLNMYRYDYSEQKEEVDNCYKLLISRYPQFAQLPIDIHNELIIQSLHSLSDHNYEEFQVNKLLTRAKNDNPESIAHSFYPEYCVIGHYTYTPYLLCSDAIETCKNYSHLHACESGGYVFDDYSSLFITDNRATLTYFNLPKLNFGENAPQYAYHYHPYSNNLSPTDTIAEDSLGCPIYIIFDGYFLSPH